MTDKLVTLLVTGLMFFFVIPFAVIFTILYILYGLLVFPVLKYLDHKYEDTVICENDDSIL